MLQEEAREMWAGSAVQDSSTADIESVLMGDKMAKTKDALLGGGASRGGGGLGDVEDFGGQQSRSSIL